MKLNNFKTDENVDSPIGNKPKKKESKREKRHKKQRIAQNKSNNQISFNFKKLPRQLRKKIKRFDKHHLNSTIRYIKDNLLINEVTITHLRQIDPMCVNCDLCLRAIGYCSVLRQSCKRTKLDKCVFKTLLKNT